VMCWEVSRVIGEGRTRMGKDFPPLLYLGIQPSRTRIHKIGHNVKNLDKGDYRRRRDGKQTPASSDKKGAQIFRTREKTRGSTWDTTRFEPKKSWHECKKPVVIVQDASRFGKI